MRDATDQAGLKSVRTTLNLSPEAVARLRLLAVQRRQSMGAVASELILRPPEPGEAPEVRNGVPLLSGGSPLPPGVPAPDLELVNRLRDEEP